MLLKAALVTDQGGVMVQVPLYLWQGKGKVIVLEHDTFVCTHGLIFVKFNLTCILRHIKDTFLLGTQKNREAHIWKV